MLSDCACFVLHVTSLFLSICLTRDEEVFLLEFGGKTGSRHQDQSSESGSDTDVKYNTRFLTEKQPHAFFLVRPGNTRAAENHDKIRRVSRVQVLVHCVCNLCNYCHAVTVMYGQSMHIDVKTFVRLARCHT